MSAILFLLGVSIAVYVALLLVWWICETFWG
jgi:hypothetical protein